MNIDPERAINM